MDACVVVLPLKDEQTIKRIRQLVDNRKSTRSSKQTSMFPNLCLVLLSKTKVNTLENLGPIKTDDQLMSETNLTFLTISTHNTLRC